MPFTPSHAVVALPFLRSPLVPAAIAIGAMTPDLPIFLRGALVPYSLTHRWDAIAVTVVIALILFVLWRCALRPGVRELLPEPIARRLPGEWDTPARRAWREAFAMRGRQNASLRGVFVVVLSAALGVASHILWDLFTHEGRWGVERIPALAQDWGPVAGYRWLQHGSSAIGLLVIGVWALVWLGRRTPRAVVRVMPDAVRWAVWAALPVLLVVNGVRGTLLWGPIRPGFGWEHLAYATAPTACALWGMVVVGVALAVQVRRRRRNLSAPVGQ